MDVDSLTSAIANPGGPAVTELGEPLTPEGARKVAKALQKRGIHTHTIELADTDPDVEQTLMDELDRGFQFPDYFGDNWNAVDECINDLSWIPADGYCCIVLNRRVLEQLKRVETLFVSLMSNASIQWKMEGKRFCLVLSP